MWGTHQQKAIEYGNVVHEILSSVKTAGDIDYAVSLGVEDGLITPLQVSTVTNTIAGIVGHHELEPFFDGENQVMNEQTIIRKEGNAVKPDRLVVSKNGEVSILDYKTGVHNSKYTIQLEGYQQAIEKMGYKVTKKVLVYIGEIVNVVNL